MLFKYFEKYTLLKISDISLFATGQSDILKEIIAKIKHNEELSATFSCIYEYKL